VTKQRTVLVLDAVDETAPRQGAVTLEANARFSRALLNDVAVDGPPWDDKANAGGGPKTYEVTFPAHFVLMSGAPTAPALDEYIGQDRETGRFINVATGLERGGDLNIEHRAGFAVAGEPTPPPFFLLNGGSECEVALDWLVQVPAAANALRVYVRNSQTKYGNGGIARLYLNGRLIHALDLGPKPNPDWKQGDDPAAQSLWDTAYHAWTVPVAALAGQPVAITIATDAKAENNADMVWWSRPKFVSSPRPEATFVALGEKGEAKPE
jgi:hypothetical protein